MDSMQRYGHFTVGRQNGTTTVALWGWYDHKKDEYTSLCAEFPTAVYQSGIERLMAKGRCRIEHDGAALEMQMCGSNSLAVMVKSRTGESMGDHNLPIRAEELA